MVNVPSKPKQKPHEPTREKVIKRDALALAQLIYDIYHDKKRKEQKDALS